MYRVLNVSLDNIADVTTIICIKPLEVGKDNSDQVISRVIKDTGAWEAGHVNNVIRAVNNYPDATFLGMTFSVSVVCVAERLSIKTSVVTLGCTPW